jgi:hypothetical protein
MPCRLYLIEFLVNQRHAFLFSHGPSVTSVAPALGMPDTRSQLDGVTHLIHYGHRSADFFGNIRRARHASTRPQQVFC